MAQFTPFAGLFQLDADDPFSLEDYLYFENEEILDTYLNAFVTHRHNGAPAVQAFGSAPTLLVTASGGSLLGGVEWFIGITAIDQFGGETIVQTASATLPAATNDPTAAPTAVAGAPGTLQLGTYRYGYTQLDGGGETLISPTTNVSVPFNGRVTVTVPSAGLATRIYRSFGAGPLHRLTELPASASAYVDDGSVSVNCDQYPPDENTTLSTNKITVTRPALPSGAVSWRVYASEFDFYPSPSQWSYASGQTIDIPSASASVDFTSEIEIISGTPPPVNRTIPGASLIYAVDVLYSGNYAWSLPSGSVEDALDALASAVGGGGGVTSVAASGDTGMIGDIVIAGGNGIDVSQIPAASAVVIDGSRFRNGTESYKYGSFTVNTSSSGSRQGVKVDIISGFWLTSGFRMQVSGSTPSYDDPRDYRITPNAGSGIVVSETSLGADNYQIDHALDTAWLAASGVVASAGFASAVASGGIPKRNPDIRIITANASAQVTDEIIIGAASGDITYELEASPNEGDWFTIKSHMANPDKLTIDGNGNNIDGVSSTDLNSGESTTVRYVGAPINQWGEE